jgi:hypothetical protein
MGKTEARQFTVEQLAELLANADGKYDVCLHHASDWITWVSALAGDPKLTKVNPASSEQLALTYSGIASQTETIKYNAEMRFYLKK